VEGEDLDVPTFLRQKIGKKSHSAHRG
jgi:hypothetical protein